jgi:creatinine amidohydrolase
MKEFRLERMTYVMAEEYAKAGAVVILPVSPLEAHGPHLPLGVDIFGADQLANLSAEQLNRGGIPTVVAPVLPYAVAKVAMPFAGTVAIEPETLTALISDIAGSFKYHGFKGTVIVCQHLEPENLIALRKVASELSEAGSAVIIVNPFHTEAKTMHAMMKGEYPELDLHAGEWETAFCQWMYPDLVKEELLGSLAPRWVDLKQKFMKEGCKDFLEAGGADCYFGDPSCATPDLGKEIYEALAEALAHRVTEWLKELGK